MNKITLPQGIATGGPDEIDLLKNFLEQMKKNEAVCRSFELCAAICAEYMSTKEMEMAAVFQKLMRVLDEMKFETRPQWNSGS